MKYRILSLLLALLLLTGCSGTYSPADAPSASAVETALPSGEATNQEAENITLQNLPDYAGSPYVELNGNVPQFDPDQFNTQSYEFYTDLDQLGRCGACYANIGPDLMPTEERGSISSVYPSGWMQAEYDWVDGKNLYNRCHLIGFQLTGENANEHNLITGTRYLNVDGMLPFENMVAEYIRETGHHVLYRVTPLFEDSNLVASGVEMEAASVEDEEIRFHVYCYNVQPGVCINYATGESWAEDPPAPSETAADTGTTQEYILNTSSRKFHLPSCAGVESMNQENRQGFIGTRDQLIQQGYSPCGHCKP